MCYNALNLNIRVQQVASPKLVRGNRVQIPSDPVTVCGEHAADAIACPCEKAQRAVSRKPGNLLAEIVVTLPEKAQPQAADLSVCLFAASPASADARLAACVFWSHERMGKMRQTFFEDLMTAMYPSGLLHTFGVTGKISGSIGAIGEMQDVIPVIHGPRGCAFHYRCSARRRHQPFYDVLSSHLEETDIICGGEEKLRQAILDAWQRYRPKLILVVPSPVSDILNEDIRSVCAELRGAGIPVAASSLSCSPTGTKITAAAG